MHRRSFLEGMLAGALSAPVASALQTSAAREEGHELADQVSIYRDNFGVPHIVGETEEATFFGYGYAQAQDHLKEMMIQYMDAQGRLTEVLGFNCLGRGYLHFIPYEYRWDGDYLQRLLRTKKTVLENRDKIDPETYKILAAFAAGVNAYIAENRAHVPAWIQPVTAEDIEAEERSNYFRFYSINEALVKLTHLPREFPDFGSDLPHIRAWTEPMTAREIGAKERSNYFRGFGSDQFAIANAKSANGKIIHFEETHMPWANRFQNYEAHLITPGKLNAGGISWFGSPFFLDGFNEKATWSATWNYPNISDVYEEKINPHNSLQYLYDGGWRAIKVEYEEFKIKGPRGMQAVTLPCYYTHHGPIVKYDDEKHRAYAVKLPNFEGVNYSTGMFRLMKAGNLDEFKAVMASHLIPRWNFLFTDRDTLYWIDNAAVAQRASGYDWRKPVPGWTSKTEWGPYFPLSSEPQLLNPASGFVQNCNNPPWLSTVNSGIDPLRPAPYFQMDEPDPFDGKKDLNPRGERLLKILSQEKKFTLEEIKAMTFDTYVVPADVFVPLITRAYSSFRDQVTDPRVGQAVETLKTWDRRSGEESAAQTYAHFWAVAYREMFSAEKFERFLKYSRYEMDINSADEQEMALAALRQAIDRIQSYYGRTHVPWGQVNVVVRGGKFPMDGAASPLFDVLHPDHGVQQDNGQIYDDDGWGHMMVVVESEPKEIWSLLPYGESQDPSSPHYNDLAKLHSQLKLKRFWFTPQDILKHTESVWGDKHRINRMLKRT
jgi:acyl-homoserine-lactone acylase